MKLYYWQGAWPNFGDELNRLLWPILLPNFFDDDAGELFLGIGSVLDSRHPPAAHKIVAGAGYGGYEPPAILDAGWTIHWVRGPRTARRLDLPPEIGLGDPASLIDRALLRRLLGAAHPSPSAQPRGIGFMPHFELAAWGAWPRAVAEAGLVFIDPRDDPARVLAAIAGCRVLLSEAMHGVIVADALRVPWVPIAPLAPIHRAKWHDWAAALGVALAFETLPPSSLAEQLRHSGLPRRRLGRILLDRGSRPLQAAAAGHYAARAAAALRRIAATPPCLSGDAALARSRERMRTALEAVRRRHGAPILAAQ